MDHKSSSANDLVIQLVARVKDNPKYRAISEGLIRRIGEQELEKRSNLRAAVKATRNKLHQVSGAYFDRPVDYDICLVALRAAFLAGKADFRRVSQQVMCYHSSTRERLPLLDTFYSTLLADLPPARRVIDIACGLNPLAFPWMGFPEDVEYFAIDIYTDMINFINQYMGLVGINGTAVVGDVVSECPNRPVDIAFILKTIPCLEQIDKTAGIRLLNNIQAKHMVVSFPVHSLGGRRDKGMVVNYSNRFTEIVADKGWTVKSMEFSTELVFLVSK